MDLTKRLAGRRAKRTSRRLDKSLDTLINKRPRGEEGDRLRAECQSAVAYLLRNKNKDFRLRDARRLYRAKLPRAAKKVLRRIGDRPPDSVDVLHLKLKILWSLGSRNRAIATSREISAIDPEHPGALLVRKHDRRSTKARAGGWTFQKAMEGGVRIVRTGSKKRRAKKYAKIADEIVGSAAFEQILHQAGRASIHRRDHETASRLFEASEALYPGSGETTLYRGTALARMGAFDRAADLLRPLLGERSLAPAAGRQIAWCLAKLLDQSGTDKGDLARELAEIVETYLEGDGPRAPLSISVGNALRRSGRQDLAMRLIDDRIARRPDNPEGYVAKARFLLEQGNVDDALGLSREVLSRWPGHATATTNLKLFNNLSGAQPRQKETRFAWLRQVPSGVAIIPTDSPLAEARSDAAVDLAKVTFAQADWFAVGDVAPDAQVSGWTERVRGAKAGCIKLPEGPTLWRKEAIANLVASGLLTNSTSVHDQLAIYSAFYTDGPVGPGVALLMSRHGAEKFGGGEHFLRGMAGHYADRGYRPRIIGTTQDRLGETGVQDGLEYAFLPNDAASIRRYCLEERVTLVHAISGLGYAVSEALQYTNIPFVYGVHFWREAIGHSSGETYFDDEGLPIPRPEFSFIVANASAIYVNSKYTQQVIESAHGMRCPIIYSVPDDRMGA